MGASNKLLLPIEGKPMLIHVVEAVLASGLYAVRVVTGHEAGSVHELLQDYALELVHNENFSQGLSTSLRSGLGSLDQDTEAALVCLGDMPWVRAGHLQSLVDRFAADRPGPICVPVYNDRPGNPVLWPRRFFAAISRLRGDVGARSLLGQYGNEVAQVEIADDGVTLDVDDRDAFRVRTGRDPES
jgi:molybdenum cofactor cytidylyltransferase